MDTPRADKVPLLVRQFGKALEEMAFAADLNRDGTIDAEEEAVQSFKFSDTDSNCCVSRAERRASREALAEPSSPPRLSSFD